MAAYHGRGPEMSTKVTVCGLFLSLVVVPSPLRPRALCQELDDERRVGSQNELTPISWGARSRETRLVPARPPPVLPSTVLGCLQGTLARTLAPCQSDLFSHQNHGQITRLLFKAPSIRYLVPAIQHRVVHYQNPPTKKSILQPNPPTQAVQYLVTTQNQHIGLHFVTKGCLGQSVGGTSSWEKREQMDMSSVALHQILPNDPRCAHTIEFSRKKGARSV